MTTELPLLISFGALVISVFSLGWNVYRDVIRKPKLRVSFGIKRIATDGKLSEELISLSGTNCGPGEVGCTGVVIAKDSISRRLKRQWTRGFVVPDFSHPMCHKLPRRIDMAEEVHLVFPLSTECVLSYRPSRIGISDSFGRTHWASKADTREAVAAFVKRFPQPEREELTKI